jgi:lycopene beta-cyclase
VKKADVLILGAGCAGTSLAHYLEDFGYAGKVVLLDLRTKFDREQRWCSWSKLPTSLVPLVQKSWQSWTVCDENNSTVQTSETFSYQQIYAPQFFEHFHLRWQNSETPIELNLGEKVERVENKKNYVEVTTNRETLRASLVFDARHQGNTNLKNAIETRGIYLHQTFLGWKIEFPRAAFNERNATLMDFRTAQNDGVNFIYVLPYSDREALVESTSFSQNPTVWVNHLNDLTKYITENFGDDYEIKTEESGELPMTTASLPTKLDERIFAIGVAGGSARPSSGYAFHRIQRQTSAIARAIVNKEEISQTAAPRKYGFLDAVFLELIARKPDSAKDFFLRMFANIEPDVLIRFLTDESSYADDLAVISALPKMPFGVAGLQSLWRKLAAGNERNEEIRVSHGSLHNSVDKSARRLVARRIER